MRGEIIVGDVEVTAVTDVEGPFPLKLKEKTFYLRQFGDVLGEPRFVPGGRVPVDDTFVDHLVDQRDRRVQKARACVLIAVTQGGSQLLDLGAQLAAAGTVDRVAFGVLSIALFG